MIAFLKRLMGAGQLPDKLSYEEARAILEASKVSAQRALAARADTEPEMLYYLAETGDETIRREIASNPATPAKADRILADDVDPAVRSELARKIGRLLPDLLASERERVCELTLQTLQRLANDQLPRARTILAEEIRALDCVPTEIILRLAHDAEEKVCAPILEYSPLLSDNDLLEIIATARAQNALAAIAKRRGVSESVSDAIVASLDIPAVAALLTNPNAHVREDTLERSSTTRRRSRPGTARSPCARTCRCARSAVSPVSSALRCSNSSANAMASTTKRRPISTGAYG